jgi:hypothetical protein
LTKIREAKDSKSFYSRMALRNPKQINGLEAYVSFTFMKTHIFSSKEAENIHCSQNLLERVREHATRICNIG